MAADEEFEGLQSFCNFRDTHDRQTSHGNSFVGIHLGLLMPSAAHVLLMQSPKRPGLVFYVSKRNNGIFPVFVARLLQSMTSEMTFDRHDASAKYNVVQRISGRLNTDRKRSDAALVDQFVYNASLK
jgi:hypothetical protein